MVETVSSFHIHSNRPTSNLLFASLAYMNVIIAMMANKHVSQENQNQAEKKSWQIQSKYKLRDACLLDSFSSFWLPECSRDPLRQNKHANCVMQLHWSWDFLVFYDHFDVLHNIHCISSIEFDLTNNKHLHLWIFYLL